MIYWILILYLGLTFWTSLFGNKLKNDTPEAFFLAGRDLGTVTLFFTILATNFSAFYFLGFAGEGYRIGYGVYIIMALGTAFAGLSFLLLGPKVWSLGQTMGYLTPGELIYGQSGSRTLSYLFTIVMIVFTLPYLALQVVGGGLILESLTAGQISYPLSIVLLTIVTILYVIIGGMQSVAKTDVKQGLLMIVFMFVAVILIGSDLGGLTVANKAAAEIVPEAFSPEGRGDFYSPKKWFSFMVFWFFCVPMFPQLFMRFYIARNLKTLRRSALLYSLIPLFISILPIMIGVWGHISFPDLVGKEADQILPMMLSEHVGELFSALVMVGAIAAFMSTLDSQLLALSTMAIRDFYIPVTKKIISLEREVLYGRIMVAILAVIGLLIAIDPFDTIFDMGKMAFSGLAILFPTSYLLIRHRANPLNCILSIIVGLLLLLGFYYQIIPITLCLGFEPFIVIIAVASLLAVTGLRKSE